MGQSNRSAEVPQGVGLDGLRRAAADCRACELWQPATQTVFGEGPDDARVVLVGEQPGDREDREGEPFVGPSGRLLDRVLVEAGIDRRQTYVTNVVKHFSFTYRGKRRIHQTPGAEHLRACRPWLDAELDLIRPDVVVCLGGTAAKALIAPSVRITRDRGQLLALPSRPGTFVLATTHPSAVLRLRDESRARAYDALVADLAVVARMLTAA